MDKRLLDMNTEMTRLERQYVKAIRIAYSVRATRRSADGWFDRAHAISVASNNLMIKRNNFACALAAQHDTALPS